MALIAAGAWVELGSSDADLSHCEKGKALTTARLLDEAAKQYEEAGDEKCEGVAASQLGETATAELERADLAFDGARAHVAMGQREAAIDQYVAGLTIDPFDATARTELGKQLGEYTKDRGGPSSCEMVESLLGVPLIGEAEAVLAGATPAANKACKEKVEGASEAASEKSNAASDESDEKAAATAYAEALALNPSLDRAKSGLEATLDGESGLDRAESRITDTVSDLEGALKWLVPLVVAVLAVAFLAWVGLRRLGAASGELRRLLEGAGGAYGFSWLRKAARPQLEIEKLGGDDGQAKAFGALLSDSLTPSGAEEQPEFPLDRVSEAAEGGALEAATKLAAEVEKAKLLGTILTLTSKLFRRRTAKFSGEILPEGDRGLGVVLNFEASFRERKRTVTLWEKDFDPAPDGEAVARVLRLVAPAVAWAQWQLLEYAQPERYEKRKKHGEAWLPKALFAAAVDREAEGQPARAAALYEDAIAHDPELTKVSTSPLAAHNLAKIENRGSRYGDHAGRHKEAAALAARVGGAIKAWRALETAEDPGGSHAWDKFDRWATVECASLYSLALAQAYAAGGKRPEKARATAEDLVETLKDGIEKKAVGERALPSRDREELAESLPPAEILLAKLEALCDPENAEEKPPPAGRISRRTHYNLACYYVALAGLRRFDPEPLYTRAIAELDAALGSAELRQWVAHEPSLKPLPEAHKAKLDEILARYEFGPRASAPKDSPPGGGEDGQPADSIAERLAALLGLS